MMIRKTLIFIFCCIIIVESMKIEILLFKNCKLSSNSVMVEPFRLRSSKFMNILAVNEELSINPISVPSVKDVDSLREYLSRFKAGIKQHSFQNAEHLNISDFLVTCTQTLQFPILSDEVFTLFCDCIDLSKVHNEFKLRLSLSKGKIINFFEEFFKIENRDATSSRKNRMRFFQMIPNLISVGLVWEDLSHLLQGLLLQPHEASFLNGEEIASVLTSLGTLKSSGVSSDDSFKRCIIRLVELIAPAFDSGSQFCTDIQLLRSLRVISRVGLLWDELPQQFKLGITQSNRLTLIIKSRREIDTIPTLLQSLCLLKVPSKC